MASSVERTALRLIVVHESPHVTERTARRRQRIEALIKQGEAWAGKLDDLKIGIRYEGRHLFESGAKTRLFHAMSETHLPAYPRVRHDGRALLLRC